VIALARALGPPSAPASESLPLAPVSFPEVEPWVETAMFGTVADLRHLLDGGLSPNATMRAGGVPLLSLVAPDREKMRLLLDRGADVNARSQSRFTPLMVAAQFQQAGEAIRLLLERGAQVRLPEATATPFANAFPLFIASHGGNADVLPALHKAGDRLDVEGLAIGNTPRTPLVLAVTLNRSEVVRTLLDLGAPVDQARTNGRTALAAAILNHRVPLVRLLLERGANVNLVDATGMTPLMYAATTDFGDANVVDLLLAAGARTDMRDKEGMTALDRARRYGNTHLIPSLERAQP
jgi:ankyrin repeat protein